MTPVIIFGYHDKIKNLKRSDFLYICLICDKGTFISKNYDSLKVNNIKVIAIECFKKLADNFQEIYEGVLEDRKVKKKAIF